MATTEADTTVDARGAACPGPLMELIGAFREAETGAVVALLTDEEQSLTDVPEWAAESGNEVVATDDEGTHYRILVRKS
ncbi:sulfurtransferase TusA family protein [Salinirubellus salinus]|uniref:Sulfurtransferase TusA family protein n=1 Tax=Salinirubellus salinus TaxID=1364945 RepID=A0A9E7R3C3_9EURY|nr:sulfurtransferase TusA family protein [Salinirubellus salinus]UWM54620.1 sulfurtransferase TusA family protein [Salinirubellus salinus]UWM54688.1 sulfurtransferase TusA family protein [Salinirubellus salinus]